MTTDKIQTSKRRSGVRRKAKTDGRSVVVEVECPISKHEAARILGVSSDTLDQWTARYGIPHYKYDVEGNTGNRGKVVYLASDVIAFREQFKVEGGDVQDEAQRTVALVDRLLGQS